MPYYPSKYAPDSLRFYLIATAPETRDTAACPEALEGFSWGDFVERNNHVLSTVEGNELVAAWGNLGQSGPTPEEGTRVHAVVAYKRLDGAVPELGTLDAVDRVLLVKVEGGFETVGKLYNACKFRAALGESLALAREANGDTFAALSAGLARKAPWLQIKEDPAAAATIV